MIVTPHPSVTRSFSAPPNCVTHGYRGIGVTLVLCTYSGEDVARAERSRSCQPPRWRPPGPHLLGIRLAPRLHMLQLRLDQQGAPLQVRTCFSLGCATRFSKNLGEVFKSGKFFIIRLCESNLDSCQLPSSSDEHSPSRQTALALAVGGTGGSGSAGTSSSLGGGGGGGGSGGSLPHQSTKPSGNDHFNRWRHGILSGRFCG